MSITNIHKIEWTNASYKSYFLYNCFHLIQLHLNIQVWALKYIFTVKNNLSLKNATVEELSLRKQAL